MFGSHNTAEVSHSHQEPAHGAPVTVFLDRYRFEAGIGHVLRSSAVNAQDCAIFYVVARCANAGVQRCDAAASRKLLNLIGNILRARVHAGEVTHLGSGEFAVMLHDTSAQDAVHYCRSVLSVLSEVRVPWQGTTLRLDAYIGGTMVEGQHDAAELLDQAQAASRIAKAKPGCKVHMVHEQQGGMALLSGISTGLLEQAQGMFAVNLRRVSQ